MKTNISSEFYDKFISGMLHGSRLNPIDKEEALDFGAVTPLNNNDGFIVFTKTSAIPRNIPKDCKSNNG
jgi:hypothetical protein